MNDTFDDSMPAVQDDNMQTSLRALHARVMRLDAAFMALHKCGALPSGFAEAFKAECLHSLTNVRHDRTREAFDATMSTWLDEFESNR
jgi:hypothetical protein